MAREDLIHLPITNAVYGSDHPSRRPPHTTRSPQHRGTAIRSLIGKDMTRVIFQTFK